MPVTHRRAIRRTYPRRERWKLIKVTEFEPRQLSAVKKELDQEYVRKRALHQSDIVLTTVQLQFL